MKEQESAAGGADDNSPVIVSNTPLSPATIQQLRQSDPNAAAAKVVAPKFEPLDPTLIKAMKDYPNLAINGEVLGKRRMDTSTGQSTIVPDPSFIVLVPEPKQSLIDAPPVPTIAPPPPSLARPATPSGTGQTQITRTTDEHPDRDQQSGKGEGIPRNARGRGSIIHVARVITTKDLELAGGDRTHIPRQRLSQSILLRDPFQYLGARRRLRIRSRRPQWQARRPQRPLGRTQPHWPRRRRQQRHAVESNRIHPRRSAHRAVCLCPGGLRPAGAHHPHRP